MSDTPQFTQAYENLLARFPRRYRARASTYLSGLLKALAEGDGLMETNVEATRDQLLVMTASGKNLDQLASLYGVVRDQATGVQDSDFRKLVPVLGLTTKAISSTLQKVVDIIYGPYATHANVTCSAPEPYALSAGSALTVLVDGRAISIVFQEGDAVSLSAATALEVATAIGQRTGGQVSGSVVSNVHTGANYVNIQTPTIGTQGFIQVLGGSAQTALRFPEIRSTLQGIGTWSVARYAGSAEMAFSVVSGNGPGLQTAGVKVGDYVTIRPDSGFQPGNCGSFPVTFVSETAFRCLNPTGVPEVNNVEQAHVDDFTFFRPDLANILLAARPATITQSAPSELTITLPVTSPIVKRVLPGSHHFHGGIASVTATAPTTMTLSTANGFAASGSVRMATSRDASIGVISSVGSGVASLISAEGWPSAGAFYSPTTDSYFYYSGLSGTHLTGVIPQPPTSIVGSTVSFSRRYSYSGVSGSQLTGVYPSPSEALGFEVVADVALAGAFIGSFRYDLTAPFIPSQYGTTVTAKVEQGSSQTVLQVADISTWPASGSFLVEYGTGAQEGPIKYLGKVGTTGLLIDPGHVFALDHPAGVSIRCVRQVGVFAPSKDGSDYPVYITDTSLARSLVSTYLSQIAAAGITLVFNIQMPPYQWDMLPPLYTTNPTDASLSQPLATVT
jgi:hypothetical protein